MTTFNKKLSGLLIFCSIVLVLASCQPETFSLLKQDLPQIKTEAFLSSQPAAVSQNPYAIPPQTTQPVQDIHDYRTMPIAALVRSFAPAVVTVLTQDGGHGSGFFLNASGVLASNAHVVKQYSNVEILLHDGSKNSGTVLWKNDEYDLALIQYQGPSVPGAVNVGDSDQVAIGEGVVAIGSPGLQTNYGSVTHGIISAIRQMGQVNFIQTDASINGGNSGGPLFNMRGEVIGINTLKLENVPSSVQGEKRDIDGVAFALPINLLMGFLDNQVPDKPANPPVTIGISVVDLPPHIQAQYNYPAGVWINEVTPGSAAAQANLASGDILTTFGDEAVTSLAQLNILKAEYKPGDQVPVVIFRTVDGKYYSATIVLQAPSGN